MTVIIELHQHVHNAWEASMARAVTGDQQKGQKMGRDDPPDLEISRPLMACLFTMEEVEPLY